MFLSNNQLSANHKIGKREWNNVNESKSTTRDAFLSERKTVERNDN